MAIWRDMPSLGSSRLEGTRASVSWQLEMTQPRMRAAARVVRPILRWGHDRVVDAAARGFRRHVRRRQNS
jgi:hypothetical protein